MSLRLYFLRHGQAAGRTEWQGEDAARPLTADGKQRVQREGVALRALGLDLDRILTSPLLRAQQTAEIVASALGLSAKLTTDPRLAPGFGPARLKALLAAHRGAAALLLVGHEPDFSETVSHLIGGARLEVKKGGLALVELADPAALEGQLVWLIPPKVLDR
jgi:phosphohistidine phosphatase